MRDRAVLFDLDGTLVDSIDHIVHCWQAAMRSIDRELTRAEVLPTIGRPLSTCFEEMAAGRSEELVACYRAHFERTHDTMARPVPGSRELLERLRRRGARVGIVTSRRGSGARRTLEAFGLLASVDTLVTFEDTERHKPHPDPLVLACTRLGAEPGRSIYVGDAVVDVAAARAAGLRAIAVAWGAASSAELAAAEPHALVTHPDDLEAALDHDARPLDARSAS